MNEEEWAQYLVKLAEMERRRDESIKRIVRDLVFPVPEPFLRAFEGES